MPERTSTVAEKQAATVAEFTSPVRAAGIPMRHEQSDMLALADELGTPGTSPKVVTRASSVGGKATRPTGSRRHGADAEGERRAQIVGTAEERKGARTYRPTEDVPRPLLI